MRCKPFLGLLAACGTVALAGEAPIELKGTAAYHGLNVPLAVISQTRSPDLSDIRVLNARGEPVPHAWVDEPAPPAAQEREQGVPFFKAPAAASATTASQQGGWIVDLRGVKGALLELQLTLKPKTQGSHGIHGFALEHSNDLQRWHTHLANAQLISLQHQGLRLDHTRFDLGGLHARYLRLRPTPGSQPPALAGARVRSTTHHQPVPPLQWSETLAPTQCSAQFCDYTLPRHLPLEQLEWQLADANTLAPLALLVQYEAFTAQTPAPHRHRHRVRDHLRGLRDKTSPPPASSDTATAWSPLARTTAYWLRLPEGEVRSPALKLDAGPVLKLRVQPTGGMVQLGAKPPTIRVGARAATLVFLAREPAPYRLAWGGETSNSALTLAQLMPTRRATDPLPADTASVLLPAPIATPAITAASSASAPPKADAPAPSRKLWLWGVLLVALGLMGFMAWSLLRPDSNKKA
jgi:hypothetical protein